MSVALQNKLLIIWTSGDKDVAENMVFMYAMNSKLQEWWNDVTLLIWGPSSRLLVNDKELQELMKQVQDAGVRVIACKQCADNYQIAPEISKLGIEVFYTGQFLTEWIKSKDYYISF
jgi:hypothetical protein